MPWIVILVSLGISNYRSLGSACRPNDTFLYIIIAIGPKLVTAHCVGSALWGIGFQEANYKSWGRVMLHLSNYSYILLFNVLWSKSQTPLPQTNRQACPFIRWSGCSTACPQDRSSYGNCPFVRSSLAVIVFKIVPVTAIVRKIVPL